MWRGDPQKENPLHSDNGIKPTQDVLVHNEGTVFLFNPLTARAKEWIDNNVQSEPWQWFGTTLVVEHRFAWALAQGMKDEGLVLQSVMT
jgi:hypothetical protein